MEHMADTVASIDYLQLSQTNARLWPILAHVAHAHKPQLLHLCHCRLAIQDLAVCAWCTINISIRNGFSRCCVRRLSAYFLGSGSSFSLDLNVG